MIMRLLVAVVFVLVGCDQAAHERADQAEAVRLLWEGPCHDSATLLATTAGSPDREYCSNKRHRMRVQLSSGPSKEEFGALVFCECQHDVPADAGGGE